MTKSINPVDMAMGLPRQQLQWAQSIHSTINGGLEQGIATGTKDATGNFSSFSPGNTSGVLLRIGASGTTGGQYTWTSSNAAITVNHGLVDANGNPRQPIGVHIVNKDKSVDVYMPTAPTTTTAAIAPTDATANVTLYFL